MLVEKKFNTGEAILNYAEGPDAGPPLVFLHGLSDRWQFFLPVLTSLSNRWHVYAVDFRGHGSSSHTPPYRYIDHIQDITAFTENIAEMPMSIPWRKPGKYGDGLDYVSVLNKALYLRGLDSRVLTPWAQGGDDEVIFRYVTEGYDEEQLSQIECPVLIIQGNMSKGAILHDDEVEFALKRIKNSHHIYMEQCDHNLGLYSHEIAPLM